MLTRASLRLGVVGSRGKHRSHCQHRSSKRDVVAASFECPYSTLGISSSAKENEVKKAYRKLALEWHPDVSKHEGSEAVFLKLSEAYEFLLGSLAGTEGSGQPGTESWEVHDMYWSFRMSRTWAQQQKRAEEEVPAGAKHSSTSRAQVHEQLAGLRQRAAVRSTKASKICGSGGDTLDEGAAVSHAAVEPLPFVELPVDDVRTGGKGEGGGSSLQVYAAGSGQQQQGAADHAAPAGSARRKFVANSGTREQVFGQLAGLRRKAVMKQR